MSEHGAPATVEQFKADSVLVVIPLVGFPAGFQLRPGERVMVMLEGNSLAANPLVHTEAVAESPEELVLAGQVNINGEPHALQPATVSLSSDPTCKQGSLVFVVDPGSATGPKQILGIRPR